MSDGRNIDDALGALVGEAAGQRVGATEVGEPWRHVPMADPDDPTYYDRPVLKEPVWIWSVPTYFAIGGMGGAASLLGLVCRLSRRPGLARLAARARWLGVATGASGTVLLVIDLGRPERFLNMLRVFRPSSPMSVGSWVLASYAPAATLGALVRGRGPIGLAADTGAGLLGVPLAGYTGVLLGNTAVPVWSETRRSLPGLFMSSGVAAAGSVLDLFPLTQEEAGVARRYGVAGKLAELAWAERVERDAKAATGRVALPLHEGVSGSLWRASKWLTLASLVTSLLRRRRLSGVLGVAGTLAVRFAMFRAGTASARDPRATFHLQQGAAHP